jgi:LDH2 family malate/lactate/ureidoglycolate dehydrogenase
MVGAILDDLRASPPADPAAPVRAPGDARRARREECTRLGVPVDAAIWAEISTL